MARDEGEPSAIIRERVVKARKKQLERFRGRKIYCNSKMSNRDIKKFCRVEEKAKDLLAMAIDRLGFSARAYTRVLKVARTIADLEGQDQISVVHLSEAIQYRMMDKYF